jgi:DNA-binding transcriptional regulator YiaG
VATVTRRAGRTVLHVPDSPMADNSGYAYEHRLVAARTIGRDLRTDEHVHHINGDITDHDPENLIVVTPGQHRRLHAHIVTEELRQAKKTLAKAEARQRDLDHEAERIADLGRGLELRALREKRGVNQSDLARELNTDVAYLSRVETGATRSTRKFLDRAFACLEDMPPSQKARTAFPGPCVKCGAEAATYAKRMCPACYKATRYVRVTVKCACGKRTGHESGRCSACRKAEFASHRTICTVCGGKCNMGRNKCGACLRADGFYRQGATS